MTIWEKVFRQLHDEGISYCHWKSNEHLDRSFEGKTDFDLLIAKKDSQRFTQILFEHNFKRRASTANKNFPGMEDFVGMDPETCGLCHFHAHYQLVMGATGRKNLVFPLEKALLKEAKMHDKFPIMVPPVELEIIILMIRVALKTKLDLKNIIKSVIGRDVYPDNITAELKYLYDQVDEDKFRALVHEYTDEPVAFTKAFKGFAEPYSLMRFIGLRKAVKKGVEAYPRMSTADIIREQEIRSLSSEISVSGFASGGITLAFLGCDGSGKSSTVDEVIKWLKWKFSVVTYYMGEPKDDNWSKFLLKVAKGFRKIGMSGVYDHIIYQIKIRFASIRLSNYKAGLRDKRQGKIVVFDRFPMNQFWDMEEPMDGPRIPQDHPLAAKERAIYEEIGQADQLFVMEVTAEESTKRKPFHASEKNQIMLKKKIKAINKLLAEDLQHVEAIDTVRDQTSVWNDVKRKIWKIN